jgi:two-component system sensor histidine kinase CiaH
LEEVNKLEHLINNLLRLTKLEAEELAEHFQTTTDKIVMDEAVDRVAKSASSRSVVIKKEIKANSAIAIDPESWSQLLVILLDNAIKYSPKKSNVVIKSYKKDNRVVFEVIDNGIGIEEKSLDHVFDRFYRAESSRNKDDSGGYGLGLSIAKMIADIHKTSIVLTTQPSHGTKASVSLPIIKRSTK